MNLNQIMDQGSGFNCSSCYTKKSNYIFIFLLILLCIPLVQADSNLYGHKYSSKPAPNNDFIMQISNASEMNNSYLHFKKITQLNFSRFSIQDNGAVIIPGSFISTQGIYEFYYSDDSGRFPTNSTFRLVFSYGSKEYLDIATNLTETDALYGYCTPFSTSDYTCEYENMQALEIMNFANAYWMTRNISRLVTAEKLATSDFESSSHKPEGCNPAYDDFDCEYSYRPLGGGMRMDVTGAWRQAAMIYALWTTYQVGGNSSIFELAGNYTQGSARECDVWSGDYLCNDVVPTEGTELDQTSAHDQGFMALAYIKAYEMTGKDIYMNISKRLLDNAFNLTQSPYIVYAYARAYELFGNQSYYDKAVSTATDLSNECSVDNVCDPYDKGTQMAAYWSLYMITGKYEHYRNAITKSYSSLDPLDHNCDPINGLTECYYSHFQSSAGIGYWGAYNSYPNETMTFYNPRYLNKPNVSTDLNISVKYKGYVDEPFINYKFYQDDVFTTQEISTVSSTTTLPSSTLTKQGVYEYFINDSQGNRFPLGNGTIKVGISKGSETYYELGINTSEKDPLIHCDPLGTNPGLENDSCRLEYMQAWMINSFVDTYYNTRNTTYSDIAVNLIFSQIDDVDIYQTCDHSYDDYDCNLLSDNNPADGFRKPGSYRQGLMIFSLWNAYQNIDLQTISGLAEKYTYGSAEDCDVWAGDFDCGSGPNQAYMMLAYWKAFEMTGDENLAEIALNLSSQAVGMNDSIELVWSLWRSYEMTGNMTFFDRAYNMTDNFKDDCTTGQECSPYNKSMNIMAFWNAFINSKDVSHFVSALDKTNSERSSTTDYCDPYQGDFICERPDEQGMFTYAYWLAYRYYSLLSEINLELVLPSEVPIYEEFNASCILENTANSSQSDVDVFLLLDEGIKLIDYFIDGITDIRKTMYYSFSVDVIKPTFNIYYDNNPCTNGSNPFYIIASEKLLEKPVLTIIYNGSTIPVTITESHDNITFNGFFIVPDANVSETAQVTIIGRDMTGLFGSDFVIKDDLVIDTEEPEIAIPVTPQNGSNLSSSELYLSGISNQFHNVTGLLYTIDQIGNRISHYNTSDISDITGEFNLNFSSIADGRYYLDLYQKDAVYNIGPNSEPVRYSIDTLQPQVLPIWPENGEMINGLNVSVLINLTDSTSGIDSSTIIINIDNARYTIDNSSVLFSESSGIINVTPQYLLNDTTNYTVKVNVSDFAGNRQFNEYTFLINSQIFTDYNLNITNELMARDKTKKYTNISQINISLNSQNNFSVFNITLYNNSGLPVEYSIDATLINLPNRYNEILPDYNGLFTDTKVGDEGLVLKAVWSNANPYVPSVPETYFGISLSEVTMQTNETTNHIITLNLSSDGSVGSFNGTYSIIDGHISIMDSNGLAATDSVKLKGDSVNFNISGDSNGKAIILYMHSNVSASYRINLTQPSGLELPIYFGPDEIAVMDSSEVFSSQFYNYSDKGSFQSNTYALNNKMNDIVDNKVYLVSDYDHNENSWIDIFFRNSSESMVWSDWINVTNSTKWVILNNDSKYIQFQLNFSSLNHANTSRFRGINISYYTVDRNNISSEFILIPSSNLSSGEYQLNYQVSGVYENLSLKQEKYISDKIVCDLNDSVIRNITHNTASSSIGQEITIDVFEPGLDIINITGDLISEEQNYIIYNELEGFYYLNLSENESLKNLSIVISDVFGNRLIENFSILYDNESPNITSAIFSSLDGNPLEMINESYIITKSEFIKVDGTLIEPNIYDVYIVVDSENHAELTGSTFSLNTILYWSDNFTKNGNLYAVDTAGNEYDKRFTIYYDTGLPNITGFQIDPGSINYTVSNSSFVTRSSNPNLIFTLSEEGSCQIVETGTSINSSDNISFSYSIDVLSWENHTIRCFDRVNNELEYDVFGLFDTEEPNVTEYQFTNQNMLNDVLFKLEDQNDFRITNINLTTDEPTRCGILGGLRYRPSDFFSLSDMNNDLFVSHFEYLEEGYSTNKVLNLTDEILKFSENSILDNRDFYRSNFSYVSVGINNSHYNHDSSINSTVSILFTFDDQKYYSGKLMIRDGFINLMSAYGNSSWDSVTYDDTSVYFNITLNNSNITIELDSIMNTTSFMTILINNTVDVEFYDVYLSEHKTIAGPNNISFRILPSNYSLSGDYEMYVSCMDKAGNVLGPSEIINASLHISLNEFTVYPSYISSELPRGRINWSSYNITVYTNMNASCYYNLFNYSFNNSGDLRHSLEKASSSGTKTYEIYCRYFNSTGPYMYINKSQARIDFEALAAERINWTLQPMFGGILNVTCQTRTVQGITTMEDYLYESNQLGDVFDIRTSVLDRTRLSDGFIYNATITNNQIYHLYQVELNLEHTEGLEIINVSPNTYFRVHHDHRINGTVDGIKFQNTSLWLETFNNDINISGRGDYRITLSRNNTEYNGSLNFNLSVLFRSPDQTQYTGALRLINATIISLNGININPTLNLTYINSSYLEYNIATNSDEKGFVLWLNAGTNSSFEMNYSMGQSEIVYLNYANETIMNESNSGIYVQSFENFSWIGNYLSNQFDLGSTGVDILSRTIQISYNVSTETDTSIDFRFRLISNESEESDWISQFVPTREYLINPNVRYIQLNISLSTSNPTRTSSIRDINISFINNKRFIISNLTPGQTINLSWNISPQSDGIKHLDLSLNSSFNGYSSESDIIVVEQPDVFNISRSYPVWSRINNIYNMTVNISNTREYSLINVSLNFTFPEGMDVNLTQIISNESVYANATHLSMLYFSNNNMISLTYEVNISTAGLMEYYLNISSSHSGYYSENMSTLCVQAFSITPEIIFPDSTQVNGTNRFRFNTSYNISLDIQGNKYYITPNVTVQLNLSEGIYFDRYLNSFKENVSFSDNNHTVKYSIVNLSEKVSIDYFFRGDGSTVQNYTILITDSFNESITIFDNITIEGIDVFDMDFEFRDSDGSFTTRKVNTDFNISFNFSNTESYPLFDVDVLLLIPNEVRINNVTGDISDASFTYKTQFRYPILNPGESRNIIWEVTGTSSRNNLIMISLDSNFGGHDVLNRTIQVIDNNVFIQPTISIPEETLLGIPYNITLVAIRTNDGYDVDNVTIQLDVPVNTKIIATHINESLVQYINVSTVKIRNFSAKSRQNIIWTVNNSKLEYSIYSVNLSPQYTDSQTAQSMATPKAKDAYTLSYFIPNSTLYINSDINITLNISNKLNVTIHNITVELNNVSNYVVFQGMHLLERMRKINLSYVRVSSDFEGNNVSSQMSSIDNITVAIPVSENRTCAYSEYSLLDSQFTNNGSTVDSMEINIVKKENNSGDIWIDYFNGSFWNRACEVPSVNGNFKCNTQTFYPLQNNLSTRICSRAEIMSVSPTYLDHDLIYANINETNLSDWILGEPINMTAEISIMNLSFVSSYSLSEGNDLNHSYIDIIYNMTTNGSVNISMRDYVGEHFACEIPYTRNTYRCNITHLIRNITSLDEINISIIKDATLIIINNVSLRSIIAENQFYNYTGYAYVDNMAVNASFTFINSSVGNQDNTTVEITNLVPEEYNLINLSMIFSTADSNELSVWAESDFTDRINQSFIVDTHEREKTRNGLGNAAAYSLNKTNNITVNYNLTGIVNSTDITENYRLIRELTKLQNSKVGPEIVESLVKNTNSILECTNISRIFVPDQNATILEIDYYCKEKLNNLIVYDVVPKIYESNASNIKIDAPYANVTIVNPDPEYLFVYDKLESGQNRRISYILNSSKNSLSQFERPLILVQSKTKYIGIIIDHPKNGKSYVRQDIVLNGSVLDVDGVSCVYQIDNGNDKPLNISGSVFSNKLDLGIGSHNLSIICTSDNNQEHKDVSFMIIESTETKIPGINIPWTNTPTETQKTLLISIIITSLSIAVALILVSIIPFIIIKWRKHSILSLEKELFHVINSLSYFNKKEEYDEAKKLYRKACKIFSRIKMLGYYKNLMKSYINIKKNFKNEELLFHRLKNKINIESQYNINKENILQNNKLNIDEKKRKIRVLNTETHSLIAQLNTQFREKHAIMVNKLKEEEHKLKERKLTVEEMIHNLGVSFREDIIDKILFLFYSSETKKKIKEKVGSEIYFEIKKISLLIKIGDKKKAEEIYHKVSRKINKMDKKGDPYKILKNNLEKIKELINS
ncbi:hypothetical protein K9M79_00100 [Candidatus Woesearchaeota archaeon]|nr:hypothetical protein [Candidatus Woesearchaeota archaeon]